ncbi:MAG: hypothetical protein DME30_06050 [Verrucomicrobia bacterium]|nr:MAG: hypothetical protein DME30_06050 [Verrucomicrobiota bacterium]
MKILLSLIALAIGIPLFAQTVTPSATPPPAAAPAATPSLVPDIHSKTIMETLIAAGPVMIVLFALSVFFVMLVIVYLMTIRRGAVVSSGYMATADALLRKRDYLGMIAPLLGLLGTVLGIIRSFGALGADLGTARYVLLSKGISEALVNTCAGLAIGIPAMICYAFFRGKAQKLISELESASTHVLALLSLQFDRRSERTPVMIEDEL